ncbi:DEAD/DEAH box helicase family protein [bacterium]|nr:DEAD/DEAH box helicase family protein [bacterium]
MKLKFKQTQYQADAANAVIMCFQGQEKGIRIETIDRSNLFAREIFSNKKIELNDTDILKNVQELQKEQGLKVNPNLQGREFSIEMETGTGKTYVYIKTMYELNKKYGWSKFIVMVPSIAIREGVFKSFQITEEHFQELYGKRIRYNIYNTQNKSNLTNIKTFAETSNIEVMIMNYQAFATKSKESRKIYQKLDSLQSERPIDIIKRARPIIIIDEPQRFGEKADKIFKERVFNQLFILRYSATHKPDKEFNKIYRLDAIDAFNQKLVKKINVKGIEVLENKGTNSYLFLDRIQVSRTTSPVAWLELEVKQATRITKKIMKVEERDRLIDKSNNLAQYDGYVVKEINALKNSITFINGIELFVGQTLGHVSEDHLRRIQIRETIKSHLDKEKVMFSKGIKVLSLFFIDEVSKYRLYEASNELKGEYAKIFEEEYKAAISERDAFALEYNKYLDNLPAEQVHNGYFSIDNKGKLINSKEKRGEDGSDDVSAYDLIMKDKERLLSLKEATRFIFSHSALREGWDNPNIFQICTLKHSQSTISKRQEIGRGLRICVNSQGERMDSSVLDNDFFNINTLTLIASESYDNFARELQNEIMKSLSDRPIKLSPSALLNRIITNEKGEKYEFDNDSAMNFIFDLKMNGYIDDKYFITEDLIKDIEEEKFQVPDDIKAFKQEVSRLLQQIYQTKNYTPTGDERKNNIKETILLPNENFAKKEFKDLWNKIKVKTVYEVDFNSQELISKCIERIDNELEVKQVMIRVTQGSQVDKMDADAIRGGTSLTKVKTQVSKANSLLGSLKYDLLNEILMETNLTRKTIAKILKGIRQDKFYQFRVNPENFIKKVSEIINEEKSTTLINNITYSKIDQIHEDNIFTINNFQGSLEDNVLKVKKHIYDYVKTDSKTERKFAEDLETGDVAIYAKLPRGFYIPTPIGNYNPDWAIVFDTDKFKYIYFIAETKGTMKTLQLKHMETLKINYAKKHFQALNTANVKYDVINNYQDLMDKIVNNNQ